jgi:hypothetical protein
MTTPLERRLAHTILAAGDMPFTADDVTGNGSVAIDPDHAPNAAQNGIGSFFRRMAARRLIEPTGQVVRSAAPHRKGGAIRVWHGTTAGRLWARSVLTGDS